MKKYKNVLINSGIFLLSTILYLLLITLLSSLNIIGYKTVSIISFIYIIIIFLFTGFNLAKHSIRKGFISGIISGFANIIIMLILSLIFTCPLKTQSLTYFLILLLSSTLGGMIGINLKKEI